jgi:DNA-binding NarL/FixJ family response regulator
MNKEAQKVQLFNTNWVAYLRLDSANINHPVISEIENGIDGVLEICNSWINLVGVLNIRHLQLQSVNNKDPIVVLLHISSLLTNGTTMSEITNMLTTLSKCLTANCVPVAIGAIVDNTCTAELVKQIRTAGFAGLIPFHDIYGIDKTIDGINTLLGARLYWPKDVVDEMSGIKKKSTARSSDIMLTPRQQEVMELICSRGLSNKQIARILRISDCTVKIHVSAILKEYGLRTRTQLALAGSRETDTL